MLFTIRQARTYWGKTQREAARALGLTERTYCRYEENPAIMPVGVLARMSKATKIPFGQFVVTTDGGAEEGESDGERFVQETV